MNVESDPGFGEDVEFNSRVWDDMVAYFRRLRGYVFLLVLVLGLFLVGTLSVYVFVTPVYTAVATVGPPNPSPTTGLLALVNGSSVLGGLASRLSGGAGSSAGGDPFQEYKQLLSSNRLAEELITKDNILPLIFYKNWDSRGRRWKTGGVLFEIVSALKRAIHRPVKEHPGVDDLVKYFQKHMGLSAVRGVTERSSLVSSGPGYISVSLDARSPAAAERILNTILARADWIVRQEHLHDVLARISYISNELNHVSQSEQRQALIQTLSGQENLRIMLVSDKRFASLLVDPPYSPQRPSFPWSPVLGFSFTVFLGLVFWAFLVWLGGRVNFVRRVIAPFARGQASQSLPSE